ncbi:MAG: phage tail sheath subtilisin-like domain-containing protein [Candidatus Thermoplasmatota archaeon]|jgi:hypothetical protein|nr:phage tail sheath subtilisin-like domain-containing protein [Candidatus Thermoplasmatota archaeon]
MTLILPGVEIQVVKEIVVGQLNPAGIFGLIGITQDNADGTPKPLERASSYKALKDFFGKAIDFTIPEAKQAFQNGISDVVVSPVHSSTAQAAKLDLNDEKGNKMAVLTARARGIWGNKIAAKVKGKMDDEGKMTMFSIAVKYADASEFFDNLAVNQGDDRFYGDIINARSDLINVEPVIQKGGGKGKDAKSTAVQIPADLETTLSGGKDPGAADYENALSKLESEDDVDIVAASIHKWDDKGLAKKVHAAIEAHCSMMSVNCFNRIGFGEAPPSKIFSSEKEEVDHICKQTNTLSSDRFVYIAPHGALGAVVGLVGNLNYFESPTFKTLSGITGLERKYSPSSLKKLLTSRILPLEVKKGRGIIVEKGIATSSEQISVQRVADRSVRGTKMIGDLFIGTLNNMTGRAALKEKITEFFIQMEKDGGIVPNADGSDPAYKVDVYATDDDISKGIVRVDIAVRPVRAIDYIYGTILVRA